VWTVAGSSPRQVLIYSGNMFNELPDVPYVITMEVAVEPDPMELELPDGSRVAYTRLDHVPKSLLDNLIGEVPGELMERINTRLFMVITTQ
jgi:mRNA-degrading endonuclease toxin of MazEF toxin-antitoxin module